MDQGRGDKAGTLETLSPLLGNAWTMLSVDQWQGSQRSLRSAQKARHPHQQLAALIDWFSAGVDTVDLQEARVLLHSCSRKIG